MDHRKRRLRGSPSRDAFKQWHKLPPFPSGYYASDLDFVLVTKGQSTEENDYSGIVAILDYKQPGDTVGFSEVLAYNCLIELNFDVYIVTAKWNRSTEKCPSCGSSVYKDDDMPFSEIKVEKYKGGDWRPQKPVYETEVVLENGNIRDFIVWEGSLRKEWNKEQWIAQLEKSLKGQSKTNQP